MSDLISRKDAIDAINALHDKPNAWLDCAVEAVEALPSAQPDEVYEQGWKDGQDALREEIWERERDRLD